MAIILVVDDEPDIRALVQLNLELDGHEVVLAANGAEALARVHEAAPDLVLLDLMMPEVDGWTVLESIKAATDVAVNRIPVVMLTAFDTHDNRIRGGIEGAIRYLSKPFSPNDLRAEVKAALEGDPEPLKRRRVQQSSLEALARQEKGESLLSERRSADAPRPRLTRYEHRTRPATVDAVGSPTRDKLESLTDKQRQLLDRLATAPSVSDAATDLGVSRSNVYASLRRISRKLGVATVPELLDLVRSGDLLPGDG
jgi:DNA-binding response OmpR family regulator